MTVRDTSMEALDFCRRRGITSKHKASVISALFHAGEALTRLELSVATGLPINAITGAVWPLIHEDNVLAELARRVCRESKSGREAYPVTFNRRRVHAEQQPPDQPGLF